MTAAWIVLGVAGVAVAVCGAVVYRRVSAIAVNDDPVHLPTAVVNERIAQLERALGKRAP
ncbi:MAG: hypothetical protein WKF58_04860 [Ilumatobacteraceae bacterium]